MSVPHRVCCVVLFILGDVSLLPRRKSQVNGGAV
jgi:hypothetical protein